MREESAHEHGDELIATLAERQGGLVARRQLVSMGLDRGRIDRRIASGHLRPVHRGVYAVGHRRLPRGGRYQAAVLAVEGSALSHGSAADLWAVRPSVATLTHVSVATRAGRRRQSGIVIHRVALSPADRTVHEGIATTTLARTMVDLAASLTARAVERALGEAAYLGIYDGIALAAAIERNVGRPGAARLAAILAGAEAPSTRTVSALEELVLCACDSAGLPRPQVNARVGRYECDFVWADQRVVVETDGWRAHRSRAAFERDRDKATSLQAAGWTVLRFTWRQVEGAPATVVERVRAVLARAADGSGGVRSQAGERSISSTR